MSRFNGVHLKAMLQKNWLQMKAEKKKTITEAVFTVLYGFLIGYEVSISFNNPDIGGLGYVIFVLISPVAFQQSCVYIFNEMVKDRETKMKESLKIMGLNKYMYALSFLVQRAMWTTVTSLIMAMMTYIVNSDLIDFTQAIQLFLAIWLLAVDMLGLSLVIQNFFTDPKLAAICAPFLLFLPTGIAMLGIITPVTTLEPNNWIQYLFFLPTFPFEVILTSVFQPEQQDFFFVVSAGWAWASLVLLCPIYFFIHIYLEAIIPDAYGVTESCCFCIRGKRQVAVSEQDEHDFLIDSYDDTNKNSTINVLEDEDDQLVDAELGQRLIHQGVDQPSQNINRRQSEARAAFNKKDPIQLRRMTMQFGDFKAVDELTMSIKQDEIIALLGHNGAGKTTAIYMLTGMLMPSGGDAVIHGNSIKRDTDLVRRSLGLCQQHDVLFDTVSVEEHLRLTMRIRSNQIDITAEDRQISEILRQVMLTEHKKKLVKELSGGMKRKLSLGMALIGGTQTIILDEPTSGLDVESRQQVWELIRTLKQGRSIIMSTQHIEEADELADRVCIMSHGKVIALGTPQSIKRKFGVGYNLFIEPKSSENLSNAQITQLLATIERIFLNREGYAGITKSPDSTDKKSLFLIPISLIDRISNLMQEVEQTVPQMQVDIELNSLEDAFIKIAENDIKEEVKQNKALAQAQILMSEEEEKAAFDDYQRFQGEQSTMQKIGVIFLNRLKVFMRSSFQWYILSFPLLYVIIQLFIAYAIIVVVTDTGDLNRIVAIFFTFYFTFFLVLGQSFTAGLYAFVPMAEKKGGLRQMMHMSGLKSLEYFVGLLMGDAVLFTIPAIVISITLLFFDQIMVQSQVINFFFSYFLYGLALINMAYMFSHFFDDPETSGKYMALIFVLGLIFAPIAISLILAAIFGFDSSLSSTISIWYWINPQMCFIIQLYQLCCYGNPDLEDLSIKLFGTIDASTGLYVGVILIQIVLIFIINILLDVRHNNLYRKRGGNDGVEPPMLEVRQDVRDHEQEVRQNAHLLQDDENSYQIKAIDICKTYPSGQRMAVCRNTFGARKGEVFGLLGPNGAGKSTTFNMIAMQLPITSGEAQLMGHELLDFPLQEQGKYFGQCNQENLIWESLTVDESMNFIASLKGINGQRRENVKRLIMETLELNFFKNTISKNLSGGNKRKLCCAQALMLCPKVLFLDEPTSGVDPVSRRSLNRMVKKMNMASVLLTTHRMDEAEQLCDKIAIMINGRFVVFGSPNYLKTQYGQGYTVEIIQERQMFENPETDVRRYIAQQIPSAELIHDSTVTQVVDNPDAPQHQPVVATIGIQRPPAEVRYRVEGINVAGSNVLLSDTFAKLATLISEQRIKDFTLMRTNMEQVFINFAKFQINAAAEGEAPVAPINNN